MSTSAHLFATLSAIAFIGLPAPLVHADEAQSELHMAFVYEGNTRTGNQIHGERASVTVDRPGKAVVLYLGSYGSVTWNVEVSKQTELKSVILGGRKKQAVKGLDDRVKVVEAFGEDRRTALTGYYQIDAAETRRLIERLAERTGLAPSSFHGIYRPETPIEIKAIQDDPRLDPGFPRVAEEKFPDTPFTAVHLVDNHVSVGEFTLQGPKLNTLYPVPGDLQKLAYDPDAKQWYGIHSSLFQLDLARNARQELPLDIDAPELRASAVTFDTKRKRVLVAGNGALFAYAVADGKWSIVSGVNGVGSSHLCYLPHDDSLYDIFLDYDGNSHTIPTLVRLNVQGAVIGRRRLTGPFFHGIIGDGHHGGSGQLIPFGEKLVLIATSPNYDSGDGSRLNSVTYIFLVDPATATAKLTWKSNAGRVPVVAAKPPRKPAATDDGDREVHAVCLYEGINRRTAEVSVRRPGKKVTLFLSAYHATQWKVSVGEGTVVERVILGGYEPQKVSGLTPSTEIAGGDDRSNYGGYKIEQPRFRQVLKALHDRSGMELSSCQTAYRPVGTFVVAEVTNDPLLASDYPKPVDAALLPKLKFNAPFITGGVRHGGQNVSWGEFTQSGPNLGTLKSLPKGVGKLAYDPKRNQFYGLGGHGVTMVDLQAEKATEMDLGMDVPRLSWPSALTFDTKRRRLLLFSRSLIYQCDVDDDHKWTVLCELTATRGSVVQSAAYLPNEDTICVVTQSFSEDAQPMLGRLSSSGALMSNSRLKPPVFGGIFGRGPGSSTHLSAVDHHLVLLVYPHSHDPEASNSDSYMFIIDAKTEEVQLAWKR